MRRSLFLAKVWLLVAVVRLVLWVLPFTTVQRLVKRWGRRTPRLQRLRSRQPETLARAVGYAARFVPRASCLTQALATQVLLSRAGYSFQLRIGVSRGPEGDLQAHAWVESEGKVVIGGGELGHYSLLPVLENTAS